MNRIIAALLLCLATSFTNAQKPKANEPVQLAENAPDQYTVVKGDTLWGISGRFLAKPWRWPEVWRLNAKQIKNPHWIYPGQTIYLDRSGPYLSLTKPGAVGDERLSPKVYSESMASPIASISMDAIKPFLVQPLVVNEKDLAGAGTIVALEEKRVIVGSGDTVFAKNITSKDELWNVFRKAKPIKEPVTNEILGYEAEFLGTAKLKAEGLPATMQIVTAEREINTTDRLLPAPKPDLFGFVPHSSPATVSGRVAAIYGGLDEGGRNNVVTLTIGRVDGIEPGHVMQLSRERGEAVYREETGDKPEKFTLPIQRYGTVFIFRVFDRVSYGLVMDSDGPVRVSDIVKSPDAD